LDATEYFERELDDHRRVAEASRDELAGSFRAILAIWSDAVRAGNKLLFFGNGGSAADAQHFAAELVVRFRLDRKPIPAIALTTDTSALTAGANDLGYERVFARQIEALGRPGDVAVGSSTSGKSPNVIEAFRTARELGLNTVAFSGGDGGELPGLVDEILLVPSRETARIQEMHLTLGHTLCGALELGLGSPEDRR
jgi:D-sedoheptulose 7-phosphate isomerase